jgi:hypothetical protein
MHPTALPDDAILAQCDARRLRRSGPGGQHRNKVETAVQLLHRPTGVAAEANERRSQAENRAAALRRLRVNLALSVRAIRPEAEGPSPLWRSRCRGGRIVVSAEHADFPALLAEALDTVACREADVKAAAESLGCTTSQLVKLLDMEPRALALVNTWRQERGLRALK